MNIHSLVLVPLFMLIVFCFGLSGSSSSVNVTSSCIEKEREALLTFKNSLKDLSNRLSSWVGQDCCHWAGVRCNNKTGHVVELNLRSKNPIGNVSNSYAHEEIVSNEVLIGTEVNPSLMDFKHLEHLDLSCNYFNYSEIPEFIGNFKELRYLNLSWAAFAGDFPYSIGNLTSLIKLDLHNLNSKVDTLSWLSHLQNLQYLDLTLVNLSHASFSSQAINLLPSLSGLVLENCGLGNEFLYTLSSKSSKNLTYLSILDLRDNSFQSQFPNVICNFTSLQKLDLSSNKLVGKLPGWLDELKNLQYLDLSHNELSGSIPSSLGALLKLETLYLSGNYFTGNVSQIHLQNLSSLQHLDISNNSLALIIPSDWRPPFQLSYIDLSSCRVGPRFPLWLRTQKEIAIMDLSNASISDSIPHWVWNFSSQLWWLSLSQNQILSHIQFPNFPSTIEIFRISNSFISGNIPLNISNVLPRLQIFDLSRNSITGTIPMSLFELENLRYIDLSKNQLSGYIPENCWSKLATYRVLVLDNNNLSGEIPNSISPVCSLKFLMLSNNKFYVELPFSLNYCKELRVIDFGENKFSGNIPSLIGDLTSLVILRLRSNRFEGSLIPELCKLHDLRILDLAANNLSGLIPSCLKNFNAMKEVNQPYEYEIWYRNWEIKQGMKGIELEYTNTLPFLVNLDLSSNCLVGQIPEELTELLGLIGLNLSKNQLTGEIPKNIGKLTSLESIDFSYNHLSGIIPQSMSELYQVAYLNFSYNNLTGRIPTGYQLQTFDASIYKGNEKLCGDQVHRPCRVDEVIEDNGSDEKVDEEEKTYFYISMIIGFVVGFWIVCGTLFFKKTWRYMLFRFVENTHMIAFNLFML